MTTNPFLVEPFRFPNVHGRVGGDGGGNGGGNGGGRGGGDGGGEGPVPSPKRIRSPLPKPMPTPKSLGFVDIQERHVRVVQVVSLQKLPVHAHRLVSQPPTRT